MVGGRSQPTVSYAAAYQQLGALAQDVPKFNLGDQAVQPVGTLKWLGQLQAITGAIGSPDDIIKLRQASESLDSVVFQSSAINFILTLAFKLLSVAEPHAPVNTRGTFVATGKSFDAYAGLASIFENAASDVLIIDPYMDHSVLTDFAPLVAETVPVRLLTDKSSYKATLAPALRRWTEQHGASRKIAGRLAPSRSLHDRLIMVDRKEAWILTQSLKDFANRSPATISKAADDLSKLKSDAYETLWSASEPISI